MPKYQRTTCALQNASMNNAMAIVIRRRNSSGVRTTTARFSSTMSAPSKTAIAVASGRLCNRLFKTTRRLSARTCGAGTATDASAPTCSIGSAAAAPCTRRYTAEATAAFSARSVNIVRCGINALSSRSVFRLMRVPFCRSRCGAAERRGLLENGEPQAEEQHQRRDRQTEPLEPGRAPFDCVPLAHASTWLEVTLSLSKGQGVPVRIRSQDGGVV